MALFGASSPSRSASPGGSLRKNCAQNWPLRAFLILHWWFRSVLHSPSHLKTGRAAREEVWALKLDLSMGNRRGF